MTRSVCSLQPKVLLWATKIEPAKIVRSKARCLELSTRGNPLGLSEPTGEQEMKTDHNSEFGYGYYLLPLLRRVFFTICSSIVLCTGALASPGDLDPAFGAGGRVLTQFGTSQDEGRAIAVQPDGKIVVAGFMDPGFGLYDFAIARYNPDGTLDTSFGGGGKVTVNFGFQTNGNPTVDIANAIAIQSDGSIF